MTRQTSPRGYETGNIEEYSTIYTYDAMNRLEKTIFLYEGDQVYSERQYDRNGNLTAQTDPRGYVTEYIYDSMDRVKTVTVDGIQTVSYTYDRAGRKKTETNANGGTITYEYDGMGRINTITDPFGIVVETNEYDGNGNLISTKDAKGNTTTYQYDLAGRVTVVTTPENRNKGTYTMKYEYNVYGEKIAETDALGNRKEYDYNVAGMLIMVMFSMGTGVSYGYDKLGNLLHVKDGEGRIKGYDYGPFGLMTSYTDQEGGTTEYMYDLDGNTRYMRDRNGNTTLYEYDNRNLLVMKRVVETGDSISYEYDPSCNRKSMIDESGTYKYKYNGRNLLMRKYRDDEPLISYEYDGMGNITSVTDSLGNSTVYTYDLAGRMEIITYDGKTTTYEYDVNGNRERILYPGGIAEEYEYDGEDRLIRLVNRKPDGSILSEYSYTYDLAGRQKTKTDSYGTTEYSYDGKGRVTKVSAPGKTTVYAYDNADNRVSLIETYASEQPSGFIDLNTGDNIQYMVKRSQYTYSGNDRLLMLTEKMYDAGGKEILTKTTRYSYDGNGNETGRSVSYTHPHNIGMRRTTRGSIYGDGLEGEFPALMERTRSTYDGFNRLKQMESIQAGTRIIVEYLYDGDGLRTRKASKSSDNGYALEVTNYLYDRQHVILETDGEGNLKARYTRGINYISHLDNTNTERFYLYNGHGDVVQTVDIQGNVQNNYEYDIFGNPALTIEIYSNSIRYAGEFLDIETGLYYLRARYYNPYTGRFISEDSYWGETNNPLSLNLYTYCHNDPIMFIDPSGHVVTEWDREHLTDEEIRRLEELTNKYIVANAAGNTYDMEAAHHEAEAIRDRYRGGDTSFIGSASGYTYVMGEDNQARIYSSDEKATEHAYNRYGYKPEKEKTIVEIIQEDTAMSKPEVYNPMSGDTILRSGEILEYDISGNTRTESTTPNIPEVVTPDERIKDDVSVQHDFYGSPRIIQAPSLVPTDTGKVIIGGKQYSIYVPDFVDDTNAYLEKDGWVTIDTISLQDIDFDWGKFLSNISFEDLNEGFSEYAGNKVTRQFVIMSIISGILNSLKHSIKTAYIEVSTQKKGTEERAVIQFGITGTLLHEYAGEEILWLEKSSIGVLDTPDDFSINMNRRMFAKALGLDGKYDILISVDEKHKNDPYLGYLSVNENGEIVITPKKYPDDDAVLGYMSGFWIFENFIPEISVSNLFKSSSILPEDISKAIKAMIEGKLEFKPNR